MDALGRLVQFNRGELTGSTVTTPTTIGMQARNWTLDDANNWAAYNTTNSAGTTTHADRNHTITNEISSETVGSTVTPFTYDDNGNLVNDTKQVYVWDFKNRLREVRNATTGDLIATYWYDAENRRIRKEVAATNDVTEFILDGMHEIQETGACTHLAYRQYIYGREVDELIAIDRPLSPILEPLALKCDDTVVQPGCHASVAVSQPPVPDQLYSRNVPCNLGCDIDVNVGIIDATALATWAATCIPCAAGLPAQVSTGDNEDIPPIEDPDVQPPVQCGPCFVAGLIEVLAVPVVLGDVQLGCEPCGPHLTSYATETPKIRARLSADCLPCPATEGVGVWIEVVVATIPPDVAYDHGRDTKRCGLVDYANRLWISRNEQQSVFALTNSTGARIEGYAYDAYGAATVFKPATPGGTLTFTATDSLSGGEAGASVFRYTGRRFDAESGLLYFRSRYLDEMMGRFISRDTIGVWGDAGSLGNGKTFGANHATMGGDPTGTWGNELWSSIGSAGALLLESMVALWRTEVLRASMISEAGQRSKPSSVGRARCQYEEGAATSWGWVSEGFIDCWSQIQRTSEGSAEWWPGQGSIGHDKLYCHGEPDGTTPLCPFKVRACATTQTNLCTDITTGWGAATWGNDQDPGEAYLKPLLYLCTRLLEKTGWTKALPGVPDIFIAKAGTTDAVDVFEAWANYEARGAVDDLANNAVCKVVLAAGGA